MAIAPCQHALIGTGGVALRCDLAEGHGGPHEKALERAPEAVWLETHRRYPTHAHLVWRETRERS